MTQTRLRMTQLRVLFIHCLYLAKFKIPVLLIGYIAQMVERRNDDLDITK